MSRRKDSDDNYDKLDDYEHARLRPESLFGSLDPHTQVLPGYRNGKFGLHESTWVPALWTIFREVIDNAMDELVKHKGGDRIDIEFDPKTFICQVQDNGRGIPIREIPKLGKGPAASILLGEARSSRNFEDQGEGAGMNGVGTSAVNFTSEWFELEVDRNGSDDNDGAKKLTQRWEESTKAGKPFHKTKGPHVIRGSKTRSGTRVRFKPSSQIYHTLLLPLEFVQDRVWDLAVINPQIKVFLNGQRYQPKPGKDAISSTYFPEQRPSIADIVQDGFKSTFYIVPGFAEKSSLTFVNNIPLFMGGSLIDTFRPLFTSTVMAELERRTKKEELKFTPDMIMQGTLIFGVTFMMKPRFDSQAKVRLTSNVAKLIRDGYVASDITSMMRRNPEWVDAIIELARGKTEDKNDKLLRAEQNKMKRLRVAKLDDASARDRSACTLFVMEGDSAVGLLADEREQIHGILPLRGKIMNVRKHKPIEVIQDQAVQDLMAALGLRMGERPIRRRLRYGAIYIAADEDEDGKDITSLLINFFYEYWKDLFDPDEPFIYRFCTPYLILSKGKEVKYIYAHDYEEYQKNLGAYKGWSVVRAKGLSALNPAAWKHVLKQPVLIPITEDGKLGETLSLIFDEERVEDRKEWLKRKRT
jgi:DNA gyrase subunit B